MRLNPKSGDILWKQDLRAVAGRKPPMWGFASSPLVVDGSVIVYAGGAGDKGTLAFDAQSGALRWSAAAGDHSYSSAQYGVLDGEETVLMLTNTGLDLLDPRTGSPRLNYEWTLNNYRALQPRILDGNSVLLPTGMNMGTRRIRISRNAQGWAADVLWTSRNLKSDFNDFVVYRGHAYGFDGGLFTCIDLETGDRNWKEGRFGKGQVLLLEDSGLLLVAGEQGEVVLLKADPAAQTELTRFQALEGKTWNHPVLVGDRLYHRNSQEAACYRLPLAVPVPVPVATE
jgi:outer membrane protein assembly factor BamB